MKVAIAFEECLEDLTDLCVKWASLMEYDVLRQEISEDISHYLKNGVVIYAHDEGKIYGLMSGIAVYHFWKRRNYAHENWFFVDPEMRGQGVAKLLLKAFEAWSMMKGCAGVIVTPNSFGSAKPEEARDVIQKYGYNIHGYMLRKDL